MFNSITYSEIVKGEIDILNEEIENYNQNTCLDKINVTEFLSRVNIHLASIEKKLGINSVEYINISTKIVDAICTRIIACNNLSSNDNYIKQLSPTETVNYFARRRERLLESLNICRELENMNMDYAYRVKVFNKLEDDIESLCNKLGIDTRLQHQKNIDRLKVVGGITGEVAKDTAGCLITMAVKVAIVLVIFLILMAIFGVK